MAVDDSLHRGKEGVELPPFREDHQRTLEIGVATVLLGAVDQVMEQDAFLQRRQRIDILQVGHATGQVRDDGVDLVLGQRDQRQHLRRDAGGDRQGFFDHHAPVGFAESDQIGLARLEFGDEFGRQRTARCAHRQFAGIDADGDAARAQPG